MTMQNAIAGFSSLLGIGILILDSKTAFLGAVEGLALCFQTVIPSLFPFFLFSILLTDSFIGIPSGILRPIGKQFRFPKGAESFTIAAFLGGYPVGAQCIGLAFHNRQITKPDAERMLAYCSNAGPSFLFGIVGNMFSNQRTIWLLWGIHILCVWMTAQLFPDPASCTLVTLKKSNPSNAMNTAVKTMASVCGWIILFRVIITFLNRWFFWALDIPLQVALSGFLELSNGSCSLMQVVNEKLRFVICSGMLSFGGICVALQTASVCRGLSLRYYFFGKTLQCVLSLALSLGFVLGLGWTIPIAVVMMGLFCRKTKITGSNPKKAVV